MEKALYKRIPLRRMLVVLLAVLGMGQVARSQTNLQVLYDFAGDRQYVTATLEGFYNDPWGNTFFFIDYDFSGKDANKKVVGVGSSYMEIARCLNFWKGTYLEPVSLQVEYNGGVGFGKHNFLFGLDYFFHSKDFRNTLNVKLLYKTFNGGASSNLPVQLTLVWGLQDLFGLKGLRFNGFADIWGENVYVFVADDIVETRSFVFISEPQLWYNVGQHFGIPNFHIGGEVELTANFAGSRIFRVRPCLGAKWVF